MANQVVRTLKRTQRRLAELRQLARAKRSEDSLHPNAYIGCIRVERDLVHDLLKIEAAITSAEERELGLAMTHALAVATSSMKVAQDTDAEMRRVDAQSAEEVSAMEDLLAQQPREVKRQLARLLVRDLEAA